MIDKDLKHGDKVEFTTMENWDKKLEGRFVGYSNVGDKKCVVEYGGVIGTMIVYAVTCEKIKEPNKRLMTAKELVGKWINTGLQDTAYLVIGYN